MKYSLLVILAIIAGCYRPPIQATQHVRRELFIHADSEFTLEERQVIYEATRRLLSQANAAVYVVFDLDFSKAESLRRVPQLLRVTSETPKTQDLDQFYHGVVYGWTRQLPSLTVYLVSDRLKGEDFALHVVMHELLHALGCDHVQDPDAVLYWATSQRHKSTRMTAADMAELDRAGRSIR